MALSILNLGARRGCVINATPRPLFPQERNLLTFVQESGWASGPIWRSPEYFVASGVRSSDRPTSGEALCLPRYPYRLVDVKQTVVTIRVFCNSCRVVDCNLTCDHSGLNAIIT